MKKFKYILISSIILFIIMSISHFIHDFLSIDIIAIYFPINESIFQHMKLIYTSFFIFYLVLYLLKRKFKFNNIFLTNLISVLTCIISFLAIYLPIFFNIGDNMIFTFILLFISILLGQFISYNLLLKEKRVSLNILAISFIVIIFIIFGYLTFNPIHNDLFWDFKNRTYEKVTK